MPNELPKEPNTGFQIQGLSSINIVHVYSQFVPSTDLQNLSMSSDHISQSGQAYNYISWFTIEFCYRHL